MRVGHAAVLLLLLTAGCAAIAPNGPVAPEPEVGAMQPATPSPTAGPSAPASQQAVPGATPPPAAPTPELQTENRAGAPGTKSPALATKPPAAPAPIGPAAKPRAPPAAATPAPAGPPALDLNALKEQLKETRAIGVYTKLTLKNQVDDLLQQFRDYYQGRAKITMAQLRRSYDLLMMKVLSLLQDADPKLASAIVSSRDAIWGLLADPKKFATLEG